MSDTDASWLPELVTLESCGGLWDTYIEQLYQHFLNDWVNGRPPTFDDKRVALKRMPLTDGKEATFWHFITAGATEADREPELRRCECICWPRCIVDRVDSGRVCAWTNIRKGERSYLLALQDFSYVVILRDRGDYVLPWTAYPVEREHRRRRLEQEWKAAQGKGWCRP